ncbi:hypothetical protein [Kibdelosporangium philippinense]
MPSPILAPSGQSWAKAGSDVCIGKVGTLPGRTVVDPLHRPCVHRCG